MVSFQNQASIIRTNSAVLNVMQFANLSLNSEMSFPIPLADYYWKQLTETASNTIIRQAAFENIRQNNRFISYTVLAL
jgi:hypothetical protein